MLTPTQLVAVEALNAAANRAARHGRVSFAPSFVRSLAPDTLPPLARLIRGGRGGEVRLKIYLCLVMMATADPFNIKNPPTPTAWCRRLALPSDSGPRRVTSNIKWLAENGFIELGPRRGYAPPSIQLVSLEEKGKPFERASLMGRYVGIPIEFWRNGWIIALSPTSIALLFALLESQGGYSEPRYVPKQRRSEYGFSHNTWTEARKELEEHKFLTVSRTPQGSDFDYQRLRNSYWIEQSRFMDKPGSPLRSHEHGTD
ncbi:MULTISPECIES: hypothetical protein [Streptomyces]|uniref:hypothetical protein n=1 Tax=Streptomyces TaxID=1883 RepID=UPI0016773F42|nr:MULTISPECIES: hypothetical protein [Streptomyces]MBD3577217.1 hypothetical protein [Streptomyces sp. KD18]GGS86497.1 hypothetical protein GCM10010286_08950 [Streptomyces toxytricini]